MRRNRRVFNNYEKNQSKKILTVSLLILSIAVLAFIITFVIYSSYLDKETKIAQEKVKTITDIAKNNQENNLSQASSSIGKTINEVQEDDKNNESVNKVAINTSNMVKEKNDTSNVVENQSKETKEKKEEKLPDPTFIKPVEGEISVDFAKDTLIYSNTLQEWVTHNGIDIKAEKTTVVKAAAEGTVKSIKNDPRYGITVVVEHVNGYQTVYANLLTAEFVKEGEKLKQGQTIGTVGNTATFEIADSAHLHFELLKDNEYLNPTSYIR